MQSKGKPSRTKAERMMNLADELGDQLRVSTTAVGLHSLLAFVTEWIVSYEAAHVTLPTLSPVELLRSLMESNGLKQRDLAADLGGQPVVSAILNGRRTINARQAKALARRFNVDIAAFFEPDIEPEQRARLISGGPNAGRVRRENKR
jgi:antitoxin component HigA of HigAB toxin-antitoxin module